MPNEVITYHSIEAFAMALIHSSGDTAMSKPPQSNPCPVCRAPKAKAWHPVCADCWTHVSQEDRGEVFRLYETAKGSPAHRSCCYRIVHDLGRRAADIFRTHS